MMRHKHRPMNGVARMVPTVSSSCSRSPDWALGLAFGLEAPFAVKRAATVSQPQHRSSNDVQLG